MNLYTGLLFQGGYIHDVGLARSLAAGEAAGAAARPRGRPDAGRPAAESPCAPRRRRALVAIGSVALSPFR